MASDINNHEENEINVNESFINSSNNLNEYLIKKCSMFDTKQKCKILFDNVVQSVEGTFSEYYEQEIKNQLNMEHEFERQLSSQKNKVDLLDQIENLTVSNKLFCNTCNLSFNHRDEQIEHYKCDLHLYNLKQKLKGKAALNEEEFEKLSDISSISGGSDDSENEDDSSSLTSSSTDNEENDDRQRNKKNDDNPHYAQVARNKPKILFKLNDNTVISMLRCVLHGKKNIPETHEELLSKVKSISYDDRWCIILVAAGHFASAIYKGDQVICHKTFHRYVVRAKRGTVQSQHDNSGKFAKSAGACIRRSQEAAFKDDIRMLIGNEWKQELDKCKCIFIRVPSYNKNVLISTSANPTNASSSSEFNPNQAPFSKNDQRLRHIPFMTFRPTFNEVKRTHTVLSRLEHFNDSYLEFQSNYKTKLNESKITSPKSAKSNQKSKSKKVSKNKSKEKVSKREKDESDEEKEIKIETQEPNVEEDNENDEFIQNLNQQDLKIFNEFYTACFTNNSNKLQQLISENDSNLNEKLLNKRLNKDNGYTLLHLSSKLGHGECVWLLLLAGSDPSRSDLTHKNMVPYDLAVNKPTRDQFRRFMNDYPDRYDYVAAKITSPLSAEKMNEKSEKEKERKKQQRNKKKQKEAELKAKQKEIDEEMKEKNAFLKANEESKSKLNRCWTCGKDVTNLVPFTYYDYKFCSTICLRNHRVDNLKKN